MRFLLAVTAVLAGMTVIGTAQDLRPHQVRPTDVDNPPKSTPAPAVKGAGAANATATSKALRDIERETPKGIGSAHTGKKAPRAVALKPDKDKRNPPINLGGKGHAGGVGAANQTDSLKGRLKQKGASGHY